MSREEVMHSEYNELIDMISCLAVYNGNAKLVNGRRMSFDEVLRLE